MEATHAYIARDRHQAMALGVALPERARGAALFADISGFTPLTESLTRALGPRRGVEELTGHLNRVYDALVGDVHEFSGSIIHFAGDAVTCWFDGDDGQRAVASALAMQQTMGRQPEVAVGDAPPVTLSLKVGIAAGEVRRFTVGDPALQLLDVLAGSVLADMAAAANAAHKGDVMLTSALARSLAPELELAGWRPSAELEGRSAIVKAQILPVSPCPWPEPPPLPDAVVRPWVLPAVFERLAAGRGEFLTELRPAVAAFLKFTGIDYDEDPDAGAKLDAFIRWIQRVVSGYEGFLHHVSVGDKGSYLYCTFGAPIAHEDDAERALAAALELRTPPGNLGFQPTTQIGISQGMLRTGAYGGLARRTYGVLGDEVNLAARLMDHADPGEVLVSGRSREASGDDFTWEPILPLTLKGKSKPVAAFRLLDRRAAEERPILEAGHLLPMVGRVAERAQIVSLLEKVRGGSGRMVEILGEAGMGKSRLLAEVLPVARDLGFQVYGGQAQSIGTNTSYQAFWPVWRSFFHLPREARIEVHVASLAAELIPLSATLLPRLPLLGTALNLPIPDNDTTRSLDAKLRKASLEGLLGECLRHRSERQPILIVLEDGHWLDPLSRDLVEALARSLPYQRVMILMASRPPDAGSAGAEPDWRRLPQCTLLPLGELPAPEIRELIRLKLSRSGTGTPDASVVERLAERSQGNPFYVEELINLIRDEGRNPNDPRAWEGLDLPSSLHSLILSRMDRLHERQKPTLKVASVIGRVFEPGTISAIFPGLAEPEVRADLNEFQRLELTALERPEPHLAFIFKHVVTQEVAYETLPFATRARLHGELGLFLEQRHARALDQHLDLLAFHFDRSDHTAKRRDYLLRAASAAQARYANAAAISYYRRALPLLTGTERIGPQIDLGRVLETVGDWPAAGDAYRGALAQAVELSDTLAQARARTALADLHRKQGAYQDAARELGEARSLFRALGEDAGVAQTLHSEGSVAAQQGQYDRARQLYHESLETRRRRHDTAGVASLLSNLGIIAWFKGEFPEARRLYEESLELRRQLGNRWAIGNSLNNLGLVVRDLGEVAEARRLLEECVGINRELGDRWSTANALGSLADVALSQGDFRAARDFLAENLHVNRELGDRNGIAFSLELFAQLAAHVGLPDRAWRLAGAATALRESIGAPLSPSEKERLDQVLARAASGLDAARTLELVEQGRRLSPEEAIQLALEEAAPPA